jgi:hypothetical protein
MKKSFAALLSFVCVLFAALFALTACDTPVGGKDDEPDTIIIIKEKDNEPDTTTDTTGGTTTKHGLSIASKSVQEALLDDAKTYQESVASAEFISANYDPDLKYVILTYKVGAIKNMFLRYLSAVVVAAPGREFIHSETVGNSVTKQVKNINTAIMNFNGTVWFAGAGAFAGANVFAGLASLAGLTAEAKTTAYAAAGAATGKIHFDVESITTSEYTKTYHNVSSMVILGKYRQHQVIINAANRRFMRQETVG